MDPTPESSNLDLPDPPEDIEHDYYMEYMMDDETDVGSEFDGDCGDVEPSQVGQSWESQCAPSVDKAQSVLNDLCNLLRPLRPDQTGYLPLLVMDPIIRSRIELLELFLARYVAFNITDESLTADIKTHLQSVGKFIQAQDIIEYLTNVDALGYCWKKEPKGQYSDGHECKDVVAYRQQIFLPSWAKYQPQMQCWKQENPLLEDPTSTCPGRRVVMWFHDESTFYTNDQQQL
ncbi:hypothetical protein PAXRUDRAFT_17650 [Paxillus rubicundulus Ve08.2h10]|uniref:Uncharacterized protein n=1 Tax=Paxillus rubicundulus Ve08.2h10 TaxID=930991 RepID=A0A0D0DGW9_9AGAM|nr:hypothetical protein PAXRUDRAFT_17650 [Paxillus rubicundulus Ve08.2h10]